MRETARLAGFFAAHGIWSVSGGATLMPVLGYEQADGCRGMDRVVFDDSADAVLAGQDALEANADFRAVGSAQLSGELVADGPALPPGDRGCRGEVGGAEDG